MHPQSELFRPISLLGIDIDGTLTDGSLMWGGEAVGWTQRYAVRDGEALLRLRRAGIEVVPLSRNRTECARVRMQGLGLPIDWVGVSDKLPALTEIYRRYSRQKHEVCYLGDGREDAAVFQAVGLGCCVPDGHALARAAAQYITQSAGGIGAAEEVADLILAARGA